MINHSINDHLWQGLFCKQAKRLFRKCNKLIFDSISCRLPRNLKTGNGKAKLVFPSYVFYLKTRKRTLWVHCNPYDCCQQTRRLPHPGLQKQLQTLHSYNQFAIRKLGDIKRAFQRYVLVILSLLLIIKVIILSEAKRYEIHFTC